MAAWFSANLINIVLVAVLALVVGLILRGMLRDRKAGKSACGGNCAGCAGCGVCPGCSAGAARAPAPKGAPGRAGQ